MLDVRQLASPEDDPVRSRWCPFIAVLCLALATLLFGESSTVADAGPSAPELIEIRGTVADPSVAYIVGARVEAQRSGRAFVAVTNDSGQFVLRLPAGSYRVDTTASGFQSEHMKLRVRSEDKTVLLEMVLKPSGVPVGVLDVGKPEQSEPR